MNSPIRGNRPRLCVQVPPRTPWGFKSLGTHITEVVPVSSLPSGRLCRPWPRLIWRPDIRAGPRRLATEPRVHGLHPQAAALITAAGGGSGAAGDVAPRGGPGP